MRYDRTVRMCLVAPNRSGVFLREDVSTHGLCVGQSLLLFPNECGLTTFYVVLSNCMQKVIIICSAQSYQPYVIEQTCASALFADYASLTRQVRCNAAHARSYLAKLSGTLHPSCVIGLARDEIRTAMNTMAMRIEHFFRINKVT